MPGSRRAAVAVQKAAECLRAKIGGEVGSMYSHRTVECRTPLRVDLKILLTKPSIQVHVI